MPASEKSLAWSGGSLKSANKEEKPQ